ncbi:MAG: hypothetical protein Q9174_007116, partial [Haloplaca sp. 1 TL-2023]
MSGTPTLHVAGMPNVYNPAPPSSPEAVEPEQHEELKPVESTSKDEAGQWEEPKPVEVDPPSRPEVSRPSKPLITFVTDQQTPTPEKQTRRGFKPFKHLAREPGMQPRSIRAHSLASKPTITSGSEPEDVHTSSPPTTDASFSATQGKRHAYMEEDFPHSPHSSKDNNAPRHYTRYRYSPSN